jgi:GNAT superfamily N-acetyltransferase
MECRIFAATKAKQKVLEFAYMRTELNYIVSRWINDSRPIKAYFLYCNDVLVTIALLRKCDMDPYAEYKNPYMIDHLYTVPEHRRTGMALYVLNHIKQHDTTIAITEENVFEKAGFHRTKNMNVVIYRYP